MGRRYNAKRKKKCPVRKEFGRVLVDEYMKQKAGIPYLWILAIISGVNYSNLSKLINGATDRYLGPLDRPRMLLEITVTLMRGFRSAIPNEEALRVWLYDICPDLLVNDEGRAWIMEEAQIMLAEMNFAWPVSEGDQVVESALGPVGVLLAVTEPCSIEAVPAPVSSRDNFLQDLKRIVKKNKVRLDGNSLKEAINIIIEYSA